MRKEPAHTAGDAHRKRWPTLADSPVTALSGVCCSFVPGRFILRLPACAAADPPIPADCSVLVLPPRAVAVRYGSARGRARARRRVARIVAAALPPPQLLLAPHNLQVQLVAVLVNGVLRMQGAVRQHACASIGMITLAGLCPEPDPFMFLNDSTAKTPHWSARSSRTLHTCWQCRPAAAR